MFPTSSSIPPSQLFCRSPSASSSSMNLNSASQFCGQPSFDFSDALLQLILGQNCGNNNLFNSTTLLQSLQIQIEQQRQQQQIVAALALQQCIQQLFSGSNSSFLLDKEGLEDSSSSLTADGLVERRQQKCSIIGQQFPLELSNSQHTDSPDPPPPPLSSSAASTSSLTTKNSKILAQKNGRKRKKMAADEEEKNGKQIEAKVEIEGGEEKEEDGVQKKPKEQRKRRKRRRLEAETDSPVSGMFITEHWDEAECTKDAQNNQQLDESAAFVHVSEAARRTIAQLPNVIGDPCCALCRCRFEDVFRLAMHKCPRIRHTEYRCRECEKVFSCPANLASHRRWHRPAEAVPRRNNHNKNNGENGRNKRKSDGQFKVEANFENSEDQSILYAGKNLAHEAAKALITLGMVK